MKWEKMRLSDCCISIADGDHQPPPKADYGVPFVTISNINSSNHFDFSNTMFVPQEYYDKLDNKRKAQAGDVLYSVVGSFGIPVYIKENIPFVFQRHIAILRPNDSILPKFLYYTMLSKAFYAKADAAAIGAAQRTVSLTALRNIEIEVPDIATQHRIASILSAYDDLIENNQKQIKLLEEAAQRLYKEWFVDLRFPNYENTPVVDGVPEGWKKKTVLDMSAVLRRGISPKYNESGKYTVINQKCIRQTIMDIKESRKQEKEYAADMNLKDSDIVICSTGAGTLGRVGQVFGEYPDTTFDSHVTLIRAKNDNNNAQFLFWSLKNIQPFLMTLGQGSTNQLELPKRVIESCEIIYPTVELIQSFEKVVQPIHDKITALVSKIKSATEARDRLLPKLMNGELEV